MGYFARRKRVRESIGYLRGSITKGKELYVNMIHGMATAWGMGKVVTLAKTEITKKSLTKSEFERVKDGKIEICNEYYLDFIGDESATLTIVLEKKKENGKVIGRETRERRQEKVSSLVNNLEL